MSLEERLLEAVNHDDLEVITYYLNQGANVNKLMVAGCSILGRAVQRGSVVVVRELLQLKKHGDSKERFKVKCNVNIADVYDRTPLHYVAENGILEIAELLLQAGCYVDVSDADNVTPLYLAACRGHDELIKVLLEAGSQVNRKTSEKSSPLHIASSRGYSSTVELLLSYGAKVDALDSSDRTPLFLAAKRGHHQVVDTLINHGAKVNTEEIHGSTPLSEAVWQKDAPLVRLLLSAGAKLTKSQHLLHYCVLLRSVSIIELLLRSGCLVNIRDDCGDTPLHVAVRTGEVDMVQLLIQYGANVNSSSGIKGTTPLHEAVEGLQDSEHDKFTSILRLLLGHSCSLDMESFMAGDTALYRAILLDKFHIASALIRHGADVNKGRLFSCNIDNLCMAQRKGSFTIVRLLVFAGFDITKTPWLEILPSEVCHTYSPTSIKGWLIYVKQNPLRLSDLCRKTLRNRLGRHVYPVVRTLLIPEKIKRFLLLEEID